MEDCRKMKMSDEAKRSETWAGKECNMCGDVGFHEELLQCTRCQVRYQHTYCSIMYPNVVLDRWICDWCSHVGSNSAVKHRRMKIRIKNKHPIKTQIWSKSSDALELLLTVAQPILNGKVVEYGSISQQETIQQAGLRKQGSRLKEKRKLGVDEPSQLSKNRLRLTTSPEGIVRRYKLLSDVY